MVSIALSSVVFRTGGICRTLLSVEVDAVLIVERIVHKLHSLSSCLLGA
jgi:hypothetical protein